MNRLPAKFDTISVATLALFVAYLAASMMID
jgi:hypothetical protein